MVQKSPYTGWSIWCLKFGLRIVWQWCVKYHRWHLKCIVWSLKFIWRKLRKSKNHFQSDEYLVLKQQEIKKLNSKRYRIMIGFRLKLTCHTMHVTIGIQRPIIENRIIRKVVSRNNDLTPLNFFIWGTGRISNSRSQGQNSLLLLLRRPEAITNILRN